MTLVGEGEVPSGADIKYNRQPYIKCISYFHVHTVCFLLLVL